MSTFLLYDAENYEYILQPAGYGVLALLFVALLASLGFLGRSRRAERMQVKQLVFCGICLALGTATSFMKLASLPFGGSITLFSMLFITLTGYFYGVKTGLVAGVAYGILQLITGPYIYAPLQVLMDFPFAFGALGLSGLIRGKYRLVAGYIVGVLGRYICHVISGYIFFAEYAPEGMNPFLYTLGYNATYIVPEMVLTAVVLCIPAVHRAINQVRQQAYA